MIVVSDASVLLALANCRSLQLLESLFEEIRVPGAVFDELAVPGKPMADSVSRFLDGKVTRLEPGELVEELSGLGGGEREAMALYWQLRADLLLVDDKRARKAARANGIRISGSLGVLLLAKERGLLKSVRPLLEELQASEIYVDGRLIRKALQLAGEESDEA
ncbi:MAG: DUF3368 domain-containing protein [Acidobacteriota bacterium]